MISTLQAQWAPLPPLPVPNGGFACGSLDGKIVIAGGTNWEGGTKNWLTGVSFFSVKELRWVNHSDLPSPIAYGLGFEHPSDLLLLGGSDGKQVMKGLRYAVSGKFSAQPQLPSTLVLMSGGMVSEKMIVVGGTDDAANLAGLTRAVYSLEESKVTRLADYPGKPFAVGASAVLGDELFVFGGMNYEETAKVPVNAAEAYAFSPGKNAWRKLKELPVSARGLSAVPLDNGCIYIAGGFTEAFTANAVIYDRKSDSYRNAIPLPYAAMVALAKLDGFVYCIGGEDKMKSRTDKFFRIPVAELLK